MKDVTDEEFAEVIATGKVLVDFYSTWCQPCKPVTALLERIEVDHPGVTFVKVNIDECPDTVSLCSIGAVPTLILFEDGVQTAQHLGGMAEPTLNEWLRV